MISIIVPIYNIEAYIEKCIRSILNQTYSDFELLLINDGSTDSSYEICKKLEKQDLRIKVFTQKNSGVSATRNRGLELASGDYITFVDGDDWIAPHYLETLLNNMKEDTDLVICEFDEVDLDGNLTPQPYNYKIKQSGEISNFQAIYGCYHAHTYARIVCAKLYRKELWKDLRFKPFIYTEDHYAIFQIFENAKKIYYVHEPLYFYFQRNTSATHNFTLTHYENRLETLYFTVQKALESYPDCALVCSEEYLSSAHYTLKEYQKAHRKNDALDLIEKMQFVYHIPKEKSKIFANRLLILPKHILYYLVCFKNFITKISK